jgi:putative flippase GtrA
MTGTARLRHATSTPTARRFVALPSVAATPVIFALVGASSTAIDVSIFWLLTSRAQLDPLLANVASYSLAAVNGFVLNKLLTFRNRKATRSTAGQAGAFVLARLASLVVSSLVLAGALQVVPSLAAKLVSIVVTFGFAYRLSSRLVFR